MKGKGYLNLVLVLPPSLALTLLQALAENHMERSPLMLLLSQEASRAWGLPCTPL